MFKIILTTVLVSFGFISKAQAQIEADIEGGVVWASLNDAQIPGDSGTRISLVDDLSTEVAPAFRLRISYRLADRHYISALYAPLQVNARGKLDRDVVFMGSLYPAQSPLLAVYRFNSYRLTYRYSFVYSDNLDLAVGFTGKIRDAETSLYGPSAKRKTNIGFVPLLNLHAAYRFHGTPLGLVFDADALAAPQGRAEDVLLAATYVAGDGLELRLGYRMVEGGADNDEVYSFAWFHYAVVGLRVSFN